MAHQMESLEAAAIGNRQDITDQVVDCEMLDAGRLGPRGVAALVWRNAAVTRGGECRNLRPPAVARIRESVQQDDSWSIDGPAHMGRESKLASVNDLGVVHLRAFG